ncbi:MAG: alpha-glucan family phosphorylase, partial [Candidatus Omnitrophica bacterium]|nr:alpha-glucan family phosphorylase [Candidatus Omnitrophota bacterium]
MSQTPATTQQSFGYEDFIASIDGFAANYASDITPEYYFGFPMDPVLEVERNLLSPTIKSIAYFSMEFGIAPSIYNSFRLNRPIPEQNQFFSHEVFSNYWLCDYLFKVQTTGKMLDIPIYGGGLGVLAGDTMKSVADSGLAVAGIGILWNKGYFKQKFWYKHGQIPETLTWDPYNYPGLIPLKDFVTIDTKEGPLHLRLWKYYVYSYDKSKACPIILLDSNCQQNDPRLRKLTDQLYRSDEVWWKIFQRVILGIGGMKALASQGYNIDCYHLNEGHAALALVEKYVHLEDKNMMTECRRHFIYTCHTPVAAGHDRFRIEDVAKILPDEYTQPCQMFGKETQDSSQINLTFMCLNNCDQINAVAQKHGEITRLQFPEFSSKIQAITNGIHIHTWLSESYARLFDRYPNVFGDWRKHPENLAKAGDLRGDDRFRQEVFEAHLVNKRNLTGLLGRWKLKEDVLTIGWARRIAGYKRPALIFHNIAEILNIARDAGPLQIILAGKAHPNDDIGAAHIDDILDHIDQLNAHRQVVKVLILENYDTYFGKLLTNSVDVWLNNPLPPLEASGTSGMKALASQGYNIDCYHLNEGHAALALVEKYVHLEDKNMMT